MTRRVLLALVAGVAVVQLLGLGVFRVWPTGHDFAMVYAGAAAWRGGEDPYRFESVTEVYRQHGGDPQRTLRPEAFITLYPPPTYLVFSPLTAVDYRTARVVWLVINLVAAGGCVWLVRGLLLVKTADGIGGFVRGVGESHTQRGPPPGWGGGDGWLLATILICGLGAGASTLRLGQLTAVVLLAVLAGLRLTAAGRPILAGLVLGLAGAVKPQLVGFFVLAAAWGGAWRVGLWATVFGGLVVLLGVMRAYAIDPTWVEALGENLRRFQAEGQGVIAAGHPTAHLMINLESALTAWLPGTVSNVSGGWVTLLTAVAGCGLITLASWRAPRRRTPARGATADDREVTLGLWSAAAVLTLLVTYHRFYDTWLLVLPAAWVAVHVLRGTARRIHVAAAVVLAVFYLPNTAVILGGGDGTGGLGAALPASVHEGWFWRGVALRHQTLLLLALLGMVCFDLWRSPTRSISDDNV